MKITIFGAALLLAAGLAPAQQKQAKQPNPAFAAVRDKPGLPRVLLIGDSISIGYTLPVRKLLDGNANVHRPPANAAHTRNGLAKLDEWLGAGKWDAIHFNWGLHDLRHMDDGKVQVPLDEYERNLDAIVSRLKKTGARLIFATTTPYPEGVTPVRIPADCRRYNEAALRVMNKHGVEIDDLHAFVLPRMAELQRPLNVHFTDAGSAALAAEVVRSIQRGK